MDRSDGRGSKGNYSSVSSLTTPVFGELRNEFEQELLARDGWVMRAFAHSGPHKIADHRTAGLRENFNHPDLQIYFPLSGQIALDTFHTVVGLIKQGARFKDGDISRDVAEELPVKFISVLIDNTEFLRVIIPDKQGQIEEKQMAEPFNRQYRDRVIIDRPEGN